MTKITGGQWHDAAKVSTAGTAKVNATIAAKANANGPHKTKTFKTDVLILGAGIGGYETFRTLARLFRKKRIKKTITIVDKNNYFTFTPMLHEVASGSVEPGHCAIPVRELVHRTPHNFVRAQVSAIDPKHRRVTTSQGIFSYEHCVVALGSATNFFGVQGAEEHAYHVRDLENAIALQEAIITKLEDVSLPKVCITIVGGGFTGVEIAGQLSDMFHNDIAKLYPHKKTELRIIESSEAVLKQIPMVARKKITQRLEQRGVQIISNSSVKKVTPTMVFLSGADKSTNSKQLETDITIWCGGFKNIAENFLPTTMTEGGRIPVTDSLHHVDHPSLYGVGDIILFKDGKTGLTAPQLGEAAHKEGIYVARHIVQHIRGKKHRRPFRFESFGTLIPVGNWWGGAIVGQVIFFGRIAWWIRRTAYVWFLPGATRKLKIIIDWTLSAFGFRYVTDL